MTRRTSKAITILLLACAGILLQWAAHPDPTTTVATIASSSTPLPSGYDLVARSVDGDTVELADGRTVRYLGMDTPETVNPKKPVQCFGHEASDYNRALVEGKLVRLVRDIEDTDKYGRLLRYVYLTDGTLVNLALVAGGYARAYVWPPNIAHATEFQAAQTEAQAAGRGLWSACSAQK